MKKPIRIGLSLVTIVTQFASAQESEPTLNPDYQNISFERYQTGALIGTIFGFGSGHHIQNRYHEDNGQIFLIGEAAPFALLIGSTLLFEMGGGDTPNCTSGEAITHPEHCARRENGLASQGALNLYLATFVGFKVWEAIDLWSYDYNRRTPKEKTEPSASLMLVPIGGGTLGAFFTYRF